jgi:hypothetical protein
MLNAVTLSVMFMSVSMLCIIILNVIILIDVMLSGMAPFYLLHRKIYIIKAPP